LDDLPDTRLKEAITYHKRFLLWVGLLLFILKLGSRRQVDFHLRDPATEVLANLNRLAGTRQETLPVHDTLDHFLGHVGAAPVAVVRTKMVRRLIRMKALDHARLLGRFVVAPDGTGYLVFHRRHCPHCLVQKHESGTLYLHQVLEAKLVSAAGLALSIGTEFIENPDDAAGASAEARKQDCELKALERLAVTLKRDFPQTPLCLTGDSLFACGRGMRIARENDWSFIYTFKETHLPALWADFQGLLALSPGNRRALTLPDGTRQVYRWVSDLTHTDSDGRDHRLNAFQCQETKDQKTTTFAWITDLPVNRDTVVAIATQGGRPRWTIENQGFNIQKNSGLNLEHAYSTDPERLKTYYYLLQIAHLILQLVERGSLLIHLARECGRTPLTFLGGLKNLALRLLEAFRGHRLPDDAFEVAPAALVQIRLDTS
jgi:hypothetical protein